MNITTTQKYKCKTTGPIVQAIQWTGSNLKEVVKLIGVHKSVRDMPWVDYEEMVKRDGLKVFGPMHSYILEVGKFVGKDEGGKTFSVSGKYFRGTFDLFDESAECDHMIGVYYDHGGIDFIRASVYPTHREILFHAKFNYCPDCGANNA